MNTDIPDCYDYPPELFCMACDASKAPILEDRVEDMIQCGQPVKIHWKAAVCPTCGSLLCDRDLDYAILRHGRKESSDGQSADD